MMLERLKNQRFVFCGLLIIFIFGLSSCGGGGSEEDDSSDTTATVSCSGNASQSPVTVTVGSACEQTSAGNGSNSGFNFFTFEAGTAGAHSISVQNVSPASANLDWQLYSDSGFNNAITTCTGSITGNETCTATLSPSTSYYLIVQNQDEAEVSYSLLITVL
ncbi:MAG: hypothetical protein HQM13_09500 [SAR324 cluster bacterium]|nr:hypothetical protein [SAR324 cluster bacterium]